MKKIYILSLVLFSAFFAVLRATADNEPLKNLKIFFANDKVGVECSFPHNDFLYISLPLDGDWSDIFDGYPENEIARRCDDIRIEGDEQNQIFWIADVANFSRPVSVPFISSTENKDGIKTLYYSDDGEITSSSLVTTVSTSSSSSISSATSSATSSLSASSTSVLNDLNSTFSLESASSSDSSASSTPVSEEEILSTSTASYAATTTVPEVLETIPASAEKINTQATTTEVATSSEEIPAPAEIPEILQEEVLPISGN